MNKPLFAIGETVIRQAPIGHFPEGNGEYVVEEIITQGDFRMVYSNALWTNLGVGYYYKLSGFKVVSVTGMNLHHSNEGFLKKKHKPSDQSFDQIMSSLKQPQKA